MQKSSNNIRECKKIQNEGGLIPGIQGWLTIKKITNIIPHVNMLRKKNHAIVALGAEKACDRLQPYPAK